MAEPTTECRQWRLDAVDLAIGLIDEPQRSELLSHSARCPDCATELAELAAVSDALLVAVPPMPAPMGFDAAVMRRIAEEAPISTPLTSVKEASGVGRRSEKTLVLAGRRGWRAPRTWLLVGAATFAIVAGIIAGQVLSGPQGSTGTQHATLRSADGTKTRGTFVLVDDPVDNGSRKIAVFDLSETPDGVKYRCEVVLTDGTRVPAGVWTAEGGPITWSFPITSSLAKADRVEMTVVGSEADGKIWAQAKLA